jgi:hypothetical protein
LGFIKLKIKVSEKKNSLTHCFITTNNLFLCLVVFKKTKKISGHVTGFPAQYAPS